MRIDAYSRIRTIHTTPTMRSEAHSMPNLSEANRILEFVSSTQILEYGSLRSAIWLQSERYRSEAKRIMTVKVVSRWNKHVCFHWVSDVPHSVTLQAVTLFIH